MFRLIAELSEFNIDNVRLPKIPGLGMLMKLPANQKLSMIVGVLNTQKGQFLPKWQEAANQKWGYVQLLDYQVDQPADGSCLVRIRIDVGEADYDKAIDAIIPHLFEPQDAQKVLGEAYSGAADVPSVMAYLHQVSAGKKEFYLVKTMSVKKERIMRNVEQAAAQSAVIGVKNLRFFLKQ